MVTSDFRPEVEIRPFSACAVRLVTLSTYRRYINKLSIYLSGHNYRNSSVIVDLSIRQIPRSTERISSFFILFLLLILYIKAKYFIEVYTTSVHSKAWH